VAGQVISAKASEAGAKISVQASLLKEKIQSKQFGQNIMAKFGKKKNEEG